MCESEAVQSPVRNPDDGQDQVDPAPQIGDTSLIQPTGRSGLDPVDYGPRSSGHSFDPPRCGGGATFDPPGGRGYDGI